MPSAPLVLVLNAGSSTLKAAVVDSAGRRLWQAQSGWTIGAADAAGPVPQEDAALAAWLAEGLASWRHDLALVAHRLVHGGERFVEPTRLDPVVIGELEQLIPLAPLHNGPAIRLIHWLNGWLADQTLPLEAWACFDTAFHRTLPEAASTYAIPASWRHQGLRRYGFHGLSHQHVSQVMAVPRLISCHLGAGCSLCAIRDGRSVATTMGFTPLEGLVMASRSGSVDPGLLLHLLRQGVAPAEIDAALHHRSGLLGLSGLSGDMRELRRAAGEGHAGARLAIEVFRQRLVEGIGAMAASLGGVDAIALTGGIGEHDDQLLGELTAALAWLGAVQIRRIPADEEGQMARLCLREVSRPAG
jgi:acetate kinase